MLIFIYFLIFFLLDLVILNQKFIYHILCFYYMENIDDKIQNNFKFFLIFVLLGLFIFMIKSYLLAIFFAAVIVFLTNKPYKRLLKKIKNKNLATSIMLIMILFVIIIPIGLIGSILVSETTHIITYGVQVAKDFNLDWCTYSFCDTVKTNIDMTNFKLDKVIQSIGNYVLASAQHFLSSISSILLNLTIFIMAFFFLLRDGEKFLIYAKKMIPMRPADKNKLFSRFVQVSQAVFFNSLFIAVIQGILVGLGFWIAGVSSPVFWGVIASFFALIPVVGTAIVWAPAVIYLFLLGNYGFGVFLFLWGMLLIASVDNFIRMFMLDKELNIHPFFILISVLGGLSLFGFFGIFIGPIIVALLISVLEIYHLNFK